MKKTILIIFLILIILGIIAFAFYWFYLKPTSYVEEEMTGGIGGTLPTITATPLLPGGEPIGTPSGSIVEKITLRNLVSKDILAFWQSGTSTLQYLTKEGLFEIDYSQPQIKEEKRELGVNFNNVLSVQPSAKDKILIKYVAEGATKPSYSVLDIKTREVKNLDLYIRTATWSPDGENLFYYYSDSPLYYQENFKESNYLAQLDKNLANRKILMDFKAASDITLLWPTTTTAYITQKPSGISETTVLKFDLKNKIFTPFVSGYGLILKWDDRGQYGLLFTTSSSGSNPKLQLINKDGYVLADFPNITLPEKCVFAHSSPILYCSIFVNPVFSGVWPDAYYMGVLSIDEMIYQINLETMEAQLLNNNTFQVSDIKIGKDDKNLFFYDEKTKTLYSLILPGVSSPQVSPTPATTPTTTPKTTPTATPSR